MENKVVKSFNLIQNDLYWVYMAGFFLILLLPLHVLPPWFTPIGWGKVITFRIIISFLAFLFLWQIISGRIDISSIKKRVKPVLLVFWLLIVFWVINLLATIFSLDPQFSLWGDPIRSGGFINFSFYIIFAILAFLIIRKNDWPKILDFSIIIGVIVSIIAIFQQFAIFSKFFIPFTFRPGSTLGSPIYLGVYLVLLSFICLVFGIKSKSTVKKILYLSSLSLFLFILVFMAQTRSALLALIIGFFWFFFAYPKKLKIFKLSIAVIIIFLIIVMNYLNSHFSILENQPFIIKSAIGRALSLVEGLKTAAGESRISAWKISWEALKERPILGYGPENFKIGFDKYYDPTLPQMGWRPIEEVFYWWDRAHNFVLDISISAGVPALLVYLSILIVLFWQLQKIKIGNPEMTMISHGIQATFVGYLSVLFFSFDFVDSYIIFFLFISYSFFLISNQESNLQVQSESDDTKKGVIHRGLYKYRIPIMSLIFILLIWFLWVFNLKPLIINKDSNLVYDYSQKSLCGKVYELVEKAANLNTTIDDYLNIQSALALQDCSDKNIGSSILFMEKACDILHENVEKHPVYTKNWLMMGECTNILIDMKIGENENFITTEEGQKLKEEANYYFEKARNLSPKRQEVFNEWLKTGLITGDYEKAAENSKECIDLNPDYGACYWFMALSQGYLGNTEEFNHYFSLAKEKGYYTDSSSEQLKQHINMLIRTGDYQGLLEIYQKLILITSDAQQKAQLHSSLAAAYLELGQVENAKKEAKKIFELIQFFPVELQSQAKSDVEAFLKSLEK